MSAIAAATIANTAMELANSVVKGVVSVKNTIFNNGTKERSIIYENTAENADTMFKSATKGSNNVLWLCLGLGVIYMIANRRK